MVITTIQPPLVLVSLHWRFIFFVHLPIFRFRFNTFQAKKKTLKCFMHFAENCINAQRKVQKKSKTSLYIVQTAVLDKFVENWMYASSAGGKNTLQIIGLLFNNNVSVIANEGNGIRLEKMTFKNSIQWIWKPTPEYVMRFDIANGNKFLICKIKFVSISLGFKNHTLLFLLNQPTEQMNKKKKVHWTYG